MATKKENGTETSIRTKKISVRLSGLSPILFDRYPGNNREQLDVFDKVYLDEKGHLVLPSLNILSFLSAQNTESATQRVVGRGYKEVCKAALSYVTIEPFEIPFTRDGNELTRVNAGLTVQDHIARVMKGRLAIPNPKSRPMLNTPWELSFILTLMETPSLNEVLLREIFEQGGHAIGLGTFRGVFGKFRLDEWSSS